MICTLTYLVRGWARTPRVTCVVVGTMALGVASAAVLFTAADAALVRPSPFPRSDELVRVYRGSLSHRLGPFRADVDALRTLKSTFSSVAGFRSTTLMIEGNPVVEVLQVREISADYFELLGCCRY